jgi:hypothetical protein
MQFQTTVDFYFICFTLDFLILEKFFLVELSLKILSLYNS